MDKVISFEEILEKIDSVKGQGKGYLTNFYLDKNKVDLWIRHGLLYRVLYGGSLFLIRVEDTFFSMYYCSSGLGQLKRDLTLLQPVLAEKPVLVEIIGNDRSVKDAEAVFLHHQFTNYTTLRRMVSFPQAEEPEVVSPVSYATMQEAEQIHEWLFHYFDPFAEQLPLMEELTDMVAKQRVLVCHDGNQLSGFLIFEINGATSHLRYWFTHPEYRDKKVGSKLFQGFIAETQQSKRRLFWVIENNENAIKRYLHYGFVMENMFDKVLIYKNINDD